MLKLNENTLTGPAIGRRAESQGFRLSAALIQFIATVGDAAIVIAASLLAHYTRLGTFELPASYLYATFLLALFTINTFHWRKLYDLSRYSRRIENLIEIVGSYTLAALLVVGLGFGIKTSAEFSRLWFGIWTVYALVGLSVWFVVRSLIVRTAQVNGHLRDRLLVIGPPATVYEFTQWLDAYAPRQIVVQAIVATEPLTALQAQGRPVHVGLDTLPELAEELRPDKIVLLLDASQQDIIEAVLQDLRSLALDVELVVPGVLEQWVHRPMTRIGGKPAINLMRRPLSDLAHLAKRVEDYVLAGTMMLLLSPLFLVIGVLIKLTSKGPVFYRQKRVGFQKREFSIFKFRTMRVEHEAVFKQATADDDRVTAIGKFLRRTSLDELPQLLNVLRGEMSLVGPRPHEVTMNQEYAAQIGDYLVRHKIRPGITGWAQVNGARGETRALEDMERRIAFDLEYVDRWSVWFDIRILIRTALFFLFHKNAY
ncbi:MAG: undecaprenyl-phosphate glucose phosphotransferase [Alphaproteobacteria bacterium]